MSVNRVILVGFAGRDPEIRYTSSGTALGRFSLATNEKFKNRAGEQGQHTEWHSVVAWGGLGRSWGELITKGKLCYVEGKIRSRKWSDSEGVERKSFEIVASAIRVLSSSNGNGSKPKTEPPTPPATPSEDDNPFQQDSISNQDIPF